LAPLAIALEPSLDPAGGVELLAAAPAGDTLRLGDSVGVLDSARVRTRGVRLAMATPVGEAVAMTRNGTLRARAPVPTSPKAVVVLARAGWEPKFIVAALEERGWKVEARLIVRPDTAVVQGNTAGLDTARVGVVIALDQAAAARAGAIAQFVRSGGGLILGPEAATLPAFAELLPGTAGARRASAAITVSARDPRRALPLVPLATLGPGATALEHRDDAVAVAARRLGAGRVVYEGYDDSWRWRMTGPEGAREAHRRWWAALVAAASPEPFPRATLPGAGAVRSADAPLARMVATLGAPGLPREPTSAPDAEGDGAPGWWGALALAALLAEWASRRLRGAP
ncbi:MAG: hypothetical protein HY275_15460, partial [Gemmatimonadetes bacterium]|nr:hypothetical protein [Gemmatimonadota bacterium]